MKFIGRKKELQALRTAYAADRSAFWPIYGRRQVGKSELIVQFMAGKPGLYYVGKQAPAEAQRREFLDLAARALGEPLVAAAVAPDWKSVFELIAARWPREQKLILALDEFQWLAQTSPELPSILQELWDRSWSKSGRHFLILCGSYLGFMERQVLGRNSPLFGRRTGQILLRPFDHLEAAQFHSRYETTDLARVYAICGGIPMYLGAFDDRRSVEQNIAACLLEETSALAREPEFLLREELRDLAGYHAVLTALAQANSSPARLSQATGIETRNLVYHLDMLVELGYVQRRYPLKEGPPAARHVRYALDDPLLRFWFRFVFPRQSLLRTFGPERGLAELVRPELSAYFGSSFERLCRESLPRLYLREGVRAAFAVGEYWDAHVQIDVVGLREDQWTDLGECKWGAVPSLATVARQLEDKVRRYPNPRNATIGRRLFVRQLGARQRPPAEAPRVHTLAELYQLEP